MDKFANVPFYGTLHGDDRGRGLVCDRGDDYVRGLVYVARDGYGCDHAFGGDGYLLNCYWSQMKSLSCLMINCNYCLDISVSLPLPLALC